MPNLVTLTRPSLQITGKTQMGVFLLSNFKFPENCHNSRTNDDTDMKLGPITKLDKRNKTTPKKFDNDVILGNCDVIVIFTTYGQIGAIRILGLGWIVCKT